VNTRIAADAAGATKMDRPEWTAVNPTNGDIYCTLTNNNAANRTPANADAANPRAYGSGGNANGHIIRLREGGSLGSATTFTWDVYLFGSPATADAATVNLSGLTADNDFSSPDGIWFDKQGVCWIQTDDSAYTGTTNCMMLAAIPGGVGDGGSRTVANSVTVSGVTTTGTATTRIGAAPGAANLRRFLVGPKGCEITGIAMTPDLKTLFVNIQHPGESGTLATLQSSWPSAAGSNARPRSATVVITKDDGGTVGGTLA
jgi:secreted PhoX family phosphatase